MTPDELIQAFCPQQKAQIAATLLQPSDEKKNIALEGLNETSLALLTAPLFTELRQHQLFVFPERESAAFFYHDLEFLLHDQDKALQEKKIHYLPASYRRASKYEEVDNANVKLRSEIINKLTQDEGHYVIVSYPEALSEKILSKKYIQSNSFTVTKGEILPVETFLDFLFEYGYKQEEFVFEPGQFAWRGGIFDVFSFSEEFPYRIELAGEHVDSIRQFDTNTQLSVKETDKLHIMPYLSSVETVEERVSMMAFLGKDTICWLKNIRDIRSQLNANFHKMEEEFVADDGKTTSLNPSDFYIDGDTLCQELNRHACAEINGNTLDNIVLDINFDIKPQNTFGKNFDLLLDEWISNLEHGYQTLFLSENENQLGRVEMVMHELLDKYNAAKKTEYTIGQLYTPCDFVLHEGFTDVHSGLCVYTDHQFFEKYHRFSIRDRYKKSEQFTLKEIYDLQPGDYVVHIDHGIGIYEGLQKMEVNGKEQEVIKLSYKDGDLLYISIHSLHKISKYVGKDGMAPKLHRLGSGTWDRVKERTKKRVKELAIDLIQLYAKRKAKDGFAFSPDSYLQNELEASFIYEDTPDQVKSLNEVKNDMESQHPMDRLICGDVGFGKTEIAIRAAFKAVADSKQVAVLVPTTVLALQHYTTFSERLSGMPCTVEYVNRFKTAKQIKETLKKLKEGSIDIIIGTHRLLSKDVEFKDLGLLIVDEEQKFGVAAKEKLREIKYDVDTLTMSATPIPRTLQFSLMGARDISVITTPPPNRYPIQTEVHLFDEELIRDAVSYEISRGGQVFFVHNKIQNIYEVAGLVQRLVPDARIAVGHGQMDGTQLEEIMLKFLAGDYDVLVSTTIVESGLDVTNANTMIINDAQNFALNVLHQLRGRVGRNNKKAFCYMLVRSFEELNEQARKRLQAIEDFSDIGSGLQIAMRDLDIRGAGDILGADQSGFISEIGFEMYQKILNEAILELHDVDHLEVEMADNSALLLRDCLLETDVRAMLPNDYVSSVSERMSLYKELQNMKKEEEVEAFRVKLADMFGPLPEEAQELLRTIPLRRKGAEMNLEKISLKNNKLMAYFAPSINSPFYESEMFTRVLTFMQKNHPKVQIQEHNQKAVLTIHGVPTVKSAVHWLNQI